MIKNNTVENSKDSETISIYEKLLDILEEKKKKDYGGILNYESAVSIVKSQIKKLENDK